MQDSARQSTIYLQDLARLNKIEQDLERLTEIMILQD
jgi:hypothetical protein